MNKNTNKPIIFLCLALLLCAVPAQAATFTLQEMNFGALNNSLLMTTSMLTQAFGFSPAALRYVGLFGDSGWSAGMSGPYAQMAVNLGFTGTFNPASQQGSFTSTGTVGSATWSGVGTWSFSNIANASLNISWDSEATIMSSGSLTKPDRRGDGPWTRQQLDDVVIIQDFGLYKKSLFGIPLPFTGEFRMESEWVRRKGGPQEAFATVNLPDDLIQLSGSAIFSTGETAGNIAVVPEPSTLLLFGTTVAGLGLARWRQRMRRASQGRRRSLSFIAKT